MNNYIREIKFLIQYAAKHNCILDIWPISIDVMMFFLTFRLGINSFSSFNNAWSGILFTHRMGGKDCSHLYTSDVLTVYRKNVKKIYGHTEDIRDPILLEHYIEFAKFHNVNKDNVWVVNIASLFRVLIVQICGLVGTRAMALFPYESTVSLINKARSKNKNPFFIPYNDNVDAIDKRRTLQGVFGQDVVFHNAFCESDGKLNYKLKYYQIKVYQFKNQRCLSDTKDVFIGFSYHKWFDPGYFLHIYMKRINNLPTRKRLLQQNFKHYSHQFFFRWPTNEPVLTKHLNNLFIQIQKVTSLAKEKKITPYSARIGMATMLLQRGLSEADIYDYGAWSRPASSSAMFGYIRLPIRRKIMMSAFICFTPVTFEQVLFSPSDFSHQFN